jgi:hypothetical protein
VMIHIPAEKTPKKFNSDAFAVFENSNEIPSQYNAADKDFAGIVFVLDLKAHEAKTLTIRYAKTGQVKHSYPKRTQAELSHKINGEWNADDPIRENRASET